jgi:hypothetical protein
MPIFFWVIDFFYFLLYYLISRYTKLYHLLVSPPFGVPTGISYGPPLTDPFKFLSKIKHFHLFPTFTVKTLLKTRICAS